MVRNRSELNVLFKEIDEIRQAENKFLTTKLTAANKLDGRIVTWIKQFIASVVRIDLGMTAPEKVAKVLAKFLEEHKKVLTSQDLFILKEAVVKIKSYQKGNPEAFEKLVRKIELVQPFYTAKDDLKAKNAPPIFHAILENNVQKVKEIVAQNPEVHNSTFEGHTPLQYAIIKGEHQLVEVLFKKEKLQSLLSLAAEASNSPKIVKFLLKNGADLAEPDEDGNLPIHLASSKKLIKLLCTVKTLNAKNGEGITPLSLAIIRGDYASACFLMGKKASVDIPDAMGGVSLHYAAMQNDEKFIKLVFKEANKDKKSAEGYTPLAIAVAMGGLKGVQFLLAKGCDTKTVAKDGNTLLHLAIKNRQEDLYELLCSESGINAQNSEGWTPLHYAAFINNPKLAAFLIQKGASRTIKDIHDELPFHTAVRYKHSDLYDSLFPANEKQMILDEAAELGDTEVVQLALNKGADRYTSNRKGDFPLHLAIQGGNMDCIKLLYDEKSSVQKGAKGFTPLMRALKEKHVGAIDFLLDRKKFIPVDIPCKKGNYPIHRAIMNESLDLVQKILEADPASLERKDQDGYPPLYVAVEYQRIEIVKFLMERGANPLIETDENDIGMHVAIFEENFEVFKCVFNKDAINHQGHKDQTPLALASMKNEIEKMKFLVDEGADMAISDNKQNLPLHYAAARSLEATKLVFKKEYLNVRNKQGKTPLDRAKEKGLKDVVSFLMANS